jgi:3-hydroxymyristoyl/3-hydroxydecanoyl-(acyl carrier protein) dehydratase
MEPLMLVDRVLSLEGTKRSLKPGRAVTEHDVRKGAWYLDQGLLTPGISMESGQADLLLSAWLGVDLATQGLTLYRLLDAEVTYFRGLPAPGETARYDIRILRFFRYGDTHMFRFEFDGSVGGEPLMAMRNGIAGFFSADALAKGKGIPKPDPGPLPDPAPPYEAGLLVAPGGPGSLGPDDLAALRAGDLSPLGAGLAKAFQGLRPLTLPSGRLALLDSAPRIQRDGGAYGRGFIRAEAAIDPKAWFLTSHFLGDEVMPGTLMYDASLQAFRAFLLSLGWVPEEGKGGLFPALGVTASLRCRGQVTAATKTVAYEIHVKELSLRPGPAKAGLEPYAAADCVMFADGRPIVEVGNLALCLSGGSLDALRERLRKALGAAPKGPAPKAAGPRPGAKDGPGGKAPGGKAAGPAPKAAPGDKAKDPREGAPLPEINPDPFPPLGPLGFPPAKALPKDPPKGQAFDKEGILCLIKGRVSDIFGEPFSRFDDGSFVARLPQAPYDFMDSAVVTSGRVGEVRVGSELEASFTPDFGRWPLSESPTNQGALPYPILNEIALQPCGFLASYMGSALPFPGPMKFRNLGGQATIRRRLGPGDAAPVRTRVRLTKSSSLGQSVIQHYAFECRSEGGVVYDGVTHFGFSSPENLQRQEGLKPAPPEPPIPKAPAKNPFRRCPQGPAWPKGRFLMLTGVAPGGPLGIWANYKVDPKAWFFEAHFPFDPVWPGSLGLEAFLQAAKIKAALSFFPKDDPKALATPFQGPLLGVAHSWLYRGQITPEAKECLVGVTLTGMSPKARALSFDGTLWVDGLPIYRVGNFTVGQDASL